MLIAQITDLHLGFERDNPSEPNRQRLERVLRELIDGPNRPELLLATGDLTEWGDAESYRLLVDILSQCPFPVYPCIGNHDDRANFTAAFPEVPIAEGFTQYVVPLRGLRLIVLDTLEQGRHGGAFCVARAAWLAERLAEDRDTPVVIVMHHPPVDIGIDWMRTHAGEPWVARFAAAIAGRKQVQAILCGHVHRPIVAPWRGVTVAICPATAPGVALDLRDIDAESPDNRPMVIGDAPGYALHWWNDGRLITLFDTAEPHPVLAKFDARMQPLVRSLEAERPA